MESDPGKLQNKADGEEELYFFVVKKNTVTIPRALGFTSVLAAHGDVTSIQAGLNPPSLFHGAVRLVTSIMPDSVTPVDCSPPGSSVHGILQARILEWVAISSPRGSS